MFNIMELSHFFLVIIAMYAQMVVGQEESSGMTCIL